MSTLRKGIFGLPAHLLLRSVAVGKPAVFRTLNPNLKDGVIVEIIRDTVKYLPRPLGRGLWINQRNGGFNPFLGVDSLV